MLRGENTSKWSTTTWKSLQLQTLPIKWSFTDKMPFLHQMLEGILNKKDKRILLVLGKTDGTPLLVLLFEGTCLKCQRFLTLKFVI